MGYLFVGEHRSKRAIEMGVTWIDGHLCAKNLFDAIRHAGISMTECRFMNVFYDDGRENQHVVEYLKGLRQTKIVGMGRKVQAVLRIHGIRHIELVHPAARGEIRKKERYRAHVRRALGQ